MALIAIMSGLLGFALLARSDAAVLVLSLQTVARNLSEPTSVAATGVPGDTRLFVTEKRGILRSVAANGTVNGTPVIDLAGETATEGERGMLSVAFHPQYAANRHFFVCYTKKNGDVEVSRFTMNASDPDVADMSSRRIIITVPHDKHSNHNGGALQFGPDGYLYMSVGDGGGGGDPDNNAQNIENLLGKILRLDVNGGNPYATPTSNPFVGKPGRDEIWSYGLRNPWRMSFDRQTGDLFIADVGQNNVEEINVQPAGTGGRNYGWRCYEGQREYNTAGCQSGGSYIMPVTQYDHSQGRCSVTGGVRYRGAAYPAMRGYYLYADFCSGHLYSLRQEGGTWIQEGQGQFTASISSFGEDGAGEIYATDLARGLLYKVVAPGSTDTIAPSVTLTKPASGANLRGTVELAASADDNTGVARVTFMVDGAVVNSDSAAPYSYNWNSAGVLNGSHTVTAQAVDAAGNTKLSAGVAVTVDNEVALPAPWQSADIGSVGVAGGAAYDDGGFNIAGAGSGIGGQADAFRFVYQPLNGDGQITVRTDSLQAPDPAGRAGVMVRESLATGSKHVTLAVTAGNGIQLRHRAVTGGAAGGMVNATGSAPVWLRLTRNGDNVVASTSADGTTWTHIGSQSVSMAAVVHIGIGVSSHMSGSLAQARIGNAVVGFGVPAVELVHPGHAATASGQYQVLATAEDADGISKVDFLVNNILVSTDTTAPYGFVWDTTKLADGAHTVAAVAYDRAGNVGSHTHITTVRNGAAKAADLNGDGKVSLADLSIVFSNWNRTAPTREHGDINGDGRISLGDLSVMFRDWSP